MKVAEFKVKRIFVELPSGDTVPVVHKSVVLEDGTIVRWNKKSGDWKIVYPERWVSAVTTSLQTTSMAAAHEKGRMRSEVEEFCLFRHFAERMVKLVDVETFMQIVNFLGGLKK